MCRREVAPGQVVPGPRPSSPRLSQDPGLGSSRPPLPPPATGCLRESWLRSRPGRSAEVRALPLWRLTAAAWPFCSWVSFSARGACFFVSRADASTSRLSFGVGAVNSCNNCSTPVETTFNRICSAGPCALTRTWVCSHLPAI